jgi:hypothetical protein
MGIPLEAGEGMRAKGNSTHEERDQNNDRDGDAEKQQEQ